MCMVIYTIMGSYISLCRFGILRFLFIFRCVGEVEFPRDAISASIYGGVAVGGWGVGSRASAYFTSGGGANLDFAFCYWRKREDGYDFYLYFAFRSPSY